MALASHGHTPGHMSFEVRQGNQAALVLGDAIGNHHVAFDRPDWITGADQDGETAVTTHLQMRISPINTPARSCIKNPWR